MRRPAAPQPLVVVGPTVSGKSALALELARRDRVAGDTGDVDGTTSIAPTELVSVDSMQVYRGMDVGTAKPSAAEQTAVPHHLIDLVEPTQRFTVVDYAAAFDTAMAGIHQRGARPLLVGGTGLYLRAVIDGLTPPPEFPEIAAQLEAEAAVPLGADANSAMLEPAAGELGEADTGASASSALHRRLAVLDPLAASRMEPTNLRRIVRALSVCIGTGEPFSSFGPGLQQYPSVPYRLVGIDINRDTLDARIAHRYRQQIQSGFLEEVRRLSLLSLSRTAAQALGYKELLAHLSGECSLDDALELAIARTRRFARRQQRWFARDPRIVWIPHGDTGEMADRVNQLAS